MSGRIAGYWIDNTERDADAYVCKTCVAENGWSTDRPLLEEDMFMRMSCAHHVLGGWEGQ